MFQARVAIHHIFRLVTGADSHTLFRVPPVRRDKAHDRAGGGPGCEALLCLYGRPAVVSLIHLNYNLSRAVTEPQLKPFRRTHGHLELRRDWPVVIGVNLVGHCSFHSDDADGVISLV